MRAPCSPEGGLGEGRLERTPCVHFAMRCGPRCDEHNSPGRCRSRGGRQSRTVGRMEGDTVPRTVLDRPKGTDSSTACDHESGTELPLPNTCSGQSESHLRRRPCSPDLRCAPSPVPRLSCGRTSHRFAPSHTKRSDVLLVSAISGFAEPAICLTPHQRSFML